MSHPELGDPLAIAYFQGALGTNAPDLKDAKHLKFLKVQAEKVLEEATRIVEGKFCGNEYWQ